MLDGLSIVVDVFVDSLQWLPVRSHVWCVVPLDVMLRRSDVASSMMSMHGVPIYRLT